MAQITSHFHSDEFACKNNQRTPVPVAYLPTVEYLCREILEPMRDRFGRCVVHSGFRTREHNRAVGGARNSYHVYTDHDVDDIAADVSFARGGVDEWVAAALAILDDRRNGKGGIGTYHRGNFVHIDTRDFVARWDGP